MENQLGNGEDLHVRRACPNDAQDLVEIIDVVGAEGIYIANDGSPVSAAQQAEIIRHLNPEWQWIGVIEVNNRVVATLEMVRGTFSKNRHTATFGMAVLPHFRRRSLGHSLVNAAHVWAAQQGIRKISIAVLATNVGARKFYEKHGYGVEGVRAQQYVMAGQWVDEWMMARFLL